MPKKPFISIAESHPDIACEAYGWDPKEISAGSGKKLRWICPKGHLYESAVYSRTSQQTGCPFCSGNKALHGFNDLASQFPEIASESYGWDPKLFTVKSNCKKKWRCKSGHIWNSSISSRTNGSGCPVCAGQKTLPGFNDLATINPELAAEAFGWDPKTVAPKSNKNLTWKCRSGHIWTAKPSDRHKNGCPVCAGKKTLPGFNDLASLYPEIAKQADGWDPRLIGPGSSKKMSWVCELGHKWQAIVYSRKNGNGCPTCAGKNILIGFNDLATISPELASEADGWNPQKVTISSGEKRKWKCKLGHKWETTVAHRSEGTSCPVCTGQKILTGFNDLATLNPKIATEAYEWDPSTLMPHSDKIRKWKCKEGHIYKAPVSGRSRGRGCAVCAGKQISIGINDLKSTNPEIANEAYEWDPTTLTAGSSKKVKWKCKYGHIYAASPAERTRQDGKSSGCGICDSKIVLVGFNDLRTTNPEIASQAYGWDPTTVTAGSGKKQKWICQNGHIWSAVTSSRQISGCPTCHIGGFDPNKKAYLYFLTHQSWNMFQIGITNFPEQRLESHSKLGWELIEIRGPMDGHLTQQWETAILRMLKAKGADLANSKIAGKFDGYSEAWSVNKFKVRSINELMEMTENFETKF